MYHDIPVKQLREWYYSRMAELFKPICNMLSGTYEQRVKRMSAGMEAQQQLDEEYDRKLAALLDAAFVMDETRRI